MYIYSTYFLQNVSKREHISFQKFERWELKVSKVHEWRFTVVVAQISASVYSYQSVIKWLHLCTILILAYSLELELSICLSVINVRGSSNQEEVITSTHAYSYVTHLQTHVT